MKKQKTETMFYPVLPLASKRIAAVFIPGVRSEDVLAMHNYALVAAVFTLPLRIPYREVVATNPMKC